MTHATGNPWTRAIRIASTVPAIALSASLFSGSLHAQEQEPKSDPVADLKKDVEALKRGQAEIQKQLQEIQRLLSTRAAAPAPRPRPSGPDVAGVEFRVADRPTKGENTAPLTLVEFTDYQ